MVAVGKDKKKRPLGTSWRQCRGAGVGFWVRELDPTSPKSLCAVLKLLHATAKTWCTPEKKNRGSS